MHMHHSSLVSICVLCALGGELFAAPPSATTLTPGGGQRGTTVAVVVAGTFDQWPPKVWSSSPGVTATPDKDKGKFSVAVGADAPLGVAWLRFHDDAGATQLRPFIVGGLPEQAETEPNDDAKTAPAIALPKVVNGVLAKSRDVDCFAVKLTKGQTLVASLEAHRTLRSPMDAVMEIVSADGTVLVQNHDVRDLDPEIAFVAPADGTYTVRVFAFPSAPDSTIGYFGSPACVYRLTLTTDEFIDFATPLAVEVGKEAKLTLAGWNLKATTATLGQVESVFGVANPFRITREPHPCFDLTATPTDKPLSPPFTATGRVADTKAPALIPISAEPKKPLALRLDSTALGLSLSPMLRVLDAEGKPVLKAEPSDLGRGIDATFTAAKAGEYKVEVRDLFKAAGPRHAFRLQVTLAGPDVAATVAADRFTLAVDTPLDIPITIAKKHGFSGEVVPFADGLPDGVTASVGTPAKPDPNVVVLRLTTTKAASGPIRIGVTKKGDDTFKRTATTAPLPDTDRTADLWLTATPALKK